MVVKNHMAILTNVKLLDRLVPVWPRNVDFHCLSDFLTCLCVFTF